jgi:hypothetical protein
MCTAKPEGAGEQWWTGQIAEFGGGVGAEVVVDSDQKTVGNGGRRWTELTVGNESNIHCRAWRLCHEQQDVVWGVVYV